MVNFLLCYSVMKIGIIDIKLVIIFKIIVVKWLKHKIHKRHH